MFTLPRTELTNDSYVTLSCPRSSYILVNVYNGAVLCGVGKSLSGRAGDAIYDSSDLYLAPGSNPIFGGDEIRIRRAESSSNPQVTVQAQLENELPRETSVAGVYSPNYLTIDSRGRVGAEFSGTIRAAGIKLPSTNGTNINETATVTWSRDAASLPVTSRIYGFEDYSVGEVFPSSYALIMGLLDATSLPENNGSNLSVFERISPFVENAITANARRYDAGPGQFHRRTIVDQSGQSSFLQWAMANNPYKVDFGRRQILNVPGGYQQLVWNFNQPFPTQCLMVMANINYNGSNLAAANQPFASDPASNSQGALLINNTAGGTSFGINYIAIGY